MFAQESGMKNRVREIIQVAALILFLALLANALWLAEILRNSGWDGMSWLWSPQFSAYLAAALAVLAIPNTEATRLSTIEVEPSGLSVT